MGNAIIGFTGFVGANLFRQHNFHGCFNSRNIADIHGKRYETVVCAAAPATMWQANRDPAGDLRNIRTLLSHLQRVQVDRFVLISTIAVLANAAGGFDERTDRFEVTKAYGRNRRILEESCALLFPRTHILRLPALYGPGLKKNFLFDILNPVPSFLTPEKYDILSSRAPGLTGLDKIYKYVEDIGMYRCNRDGLQGNDGDRFTDAIIEAGCAAENFTNADSTLQYYGLSQLWTDICIAISHELQVVHLAPEPLRAGDIITALTGRIFDARTAPIYHEDMHTRHADIWSRRGPYLNEASTVLRDIAVFYTNTLTS